MQKNPQLSKRNFVAQRLDYLRGFLAVYDRVNEVHDIPCLLEFSVWNEHFGKKFFFLQAGMPLPNYPFPDYNQTSVFMRLLHDDEITSLILESQCYGLKK